MFFYNLPKPASCNHRSVVCLKKNQKDKITKSILTSWDEKLRIIFIILAYIFFRRMVKIFRFDFPTRFLCVGFFDTMWKNFKEVAKNLLFSKYYFLNLPTTFFNCVFFNISLVSLTEKKTCKSTFLVEFSL